MNGPPEKGRAGAFLRDLDPGFHERAGKRSGRGKSYAASCGRVSHKSAPAANHLDGFNRDKTE